MAHTATLKTIAAIATIVPTTITVSEKTRLRLTGYKHGSSTFDQVLNRLMDAVPMEDVMAEDIAEHYRILNDPETEWVDGMEVAKWLKGERKEFPPTIRKGPWPNVPSGDVKASAQGPGKSAKRRAAPARRRPA